MYTLQSVFSLPCEGSQPLSAQQLCQLAVEEQRHRMQPVPLSDLKRLGWNDEREGQTAVVNCSNG